MKYLILLLSVSIIACGEKPSAIEPYPVTRAYDGKPLNDFQAALVSYYQVEDTGIFKICELSPGFCDNYQELEKWVINQG